MTLFIKRLRVLFHYKDLIKELVARDLKLKYRRSVLGYLWSVLDPLLNMLVMAFVFSSIFGRDINYRVYLISGQLMFNFMKTATTKALGSIVGNSALLKKVYVPKYVFALSTVTSALVDLFFSLLALFLVMALTKAPFTPYLLLIPIPILQVYIFSVGLGLLLAAMNVFFRDVSHIYSVVTTVWMYLTPIFYSIEDNPALWRYIRFNPMYIYIGQFRDLVMNGRMFQPQYLLYGAAVAVVFLVAGTLVFKKMQDKFILYI